MVILVRNTSLILHIDGFYMLIMLFPKMRSENCRNLEEFDSLNTHTIDKKRISQNVCINSRRRGGDSAVRFQEVFVHGRELQLAVSKQRTLSDGGGTYAMGNGRWRVGCTAGSSRVLQILQVRDAAGPCPGLTETAPFFAMFHPVLDDEVVAPSEQPEVDEQFCYQ